MAHEATVIREGDTPQYVAVMHSDGSLSEVQVSVGEDDGLVVTVESSALRTKTVIVDGFVLAVPS